MPSPAAGRRAALCRNDTPKRRSGAPPRKSLPEARKSPPHPEGRRALHKSVLCGTASRFPPLQRARKPAFRPHHASELPRRRQKSEPCSVMHSCGNRSLTGMQLRSPHQGMKGLPVLIVFQKFTLNKIATTGTAKNRNGNNLRFFRCTHTIMPNNGATVV